MHADIIHISGFDSYNTHDSGNYIVFNFLRELEFDSKMILALGKTKNDKDTYLIKKEQIINTIESAKVVVIHDSLLSYFEIEKLYQKLKCHFVIITMTHFHLTTQKSLGCPSYPELNSNFEKTSNSKLLEEKTRVFSKVPITLVFGSSYTEKMTNNYKIYNDKCFIPLPAEIPYCKNPKQQVRKHLSLDIDRKYIFWGTTQPETLRKGKKLFDEVLDILWNKISPEQREQIVILHVGPPTGEFGNTSNFNVIRTGYQETRKHMSIFYKASDVSVCTTIADAGPMMISESMCNETPVIAFDRSIACDLCVDGETGYLIEDLNLEKMSTSIKQILFQDDLEKMSKKSRKKYLTFQDSCAIMNKWNNLFTNLMEKE